MATLCVIKSRIGMYKLTTSKRTKSAKHHVRAYQWDGTGGWVEFESVVDHSRVRAVQNVSKRLQAVHGLRSGAVYPYPAMGPLSDEDASNVRYYLDIEDNHNFDIDTALVDVEDSEKKIEQ